MSKKFKFFKNGRFISFVKDNEDTTPSHSDIIQIEFKSNSDISGAPPEVNFYKLDEYGDVVKSFGPSINTIDGNVSGSSEASQLRNLSNASTEIIDKIDYMMQHNKLTNSTSKYNTFKSYINENSRGTTNHNAFAYLDSNSKDYYMNIIDEI
jgi:hypothetical protein